MAVAKLDLTCKKCGCGFHRRHTCYNASEREKYEAWAIENITICPDCYRAEQEENEKKAIIRAKRISTLKKVMTRAWEIFKTLTGSRNEKLSKALKKAWTEIKSAKTIAVKRWKRNEIDDDIILKGMKNACSVAGSYILVRIERETEKAIQAVLACVGGNEYKTWIPKSAIID